MTSTAKLLALMMCAFLFVTACGPETIFLRPGLDTPPQHVSNGRNLLDRGKIHAALQEFTRAKELDPEYSPAYVGLGLVSAHLGDFEMSRRYLDTANELAVTDEDKMGVEEGYRVLDQMEKAKSP